MSDHKKLKDRPKTSVYLRVKVFKNDLEASIDVLLYESSNFITRGNVTRRKYLERHARENQEKFDQRNKAMGLKKAHFYFETDDMMLTRSPKNRWWTWYSKDHRTQVSVYGAYATENALPLHKAMKHFMLYEMADRIMGTNLPFLSSTQDQIMALKMVNTMKKFRRQGLTGFYYERLFDIDKIILYLKDEDGVVKPIRTGHEVKLYNKIKSHYAKRDTSQPLDIYDIFEMSMQVTPLDKGHKINLFTTYLTAHNVMRIFARPDQWSPSFTNQKREEDYYGHRKDDAMYPMMLDLLALQSSDDQKTLPDLVMKRFPRDKKTNAVSDTGWALALFKENSLFAMQSAAKTANTAYEVSHFNAGCHYYFWIGSNFYPIWGSFGVSSGAVYEGAIKTSMGELHRADVQLDYLLGAVTSGAAIWEYMYPPK